MNRIVAWALGVIAERLFILLSPLAFALLCFCLTPTRDSRARFLFRRAKSHATSRQQVRGYLLSAFVPQIISPILAVATPPPILLTSLAAVHLCTSRSSVTSAPYAITPPILLSYFTAELLRLFRLRTL